MLSSMELVLLTLRFTQILRSADYERPADLGLESISPACFRSLGLPLFDFA